jgi:hypothetical protein
MRGREAERADQHGMRHAAGRRFGVAVERERGRKAAAPDDLASVSGSGTVAVADAGPKRIDVTERIRRADFADPAAIGRRRALAVEARILARGLARYAAESVRALFIAEAGYRPL